MNLNLCTSFRTIRVSLVFALAATLLSFSAPSVQAAVPNCSLSPLVNGSFEIPNDVTNIGAFRDDASLGTYAGIGWRTTEPTKKIEFWPTTVGVPSFNGAQFIELNGDDFSGVYQDFITAPGATLTWSLSHRGRDNFEQMAVRIGPATGSVAIPLASDSLLIRQGSLIRDTTTGWGTRSGSYVVPAGQTVTRFYLESVSVTQFEFPGGFREVFNNENINSSAGNFVDNVTLTASNCDSPTPSSPPPPSFLKAKTAPTISVATNTYACDAGSLIFWRYSTTEEPAKLSYQKISLLRDGAEVASSVTLKPSVNFEKISTWSGSTMTCQIYAVQENTVSTFSSLGSDRYNDLSKIKSATIKASEAKYFADRKAAYDKRRIELSRISDTRASELKNSKSSAQIKAASERYRLAYSRTSETWKTELQTATAARTATKLGAVTTFTQSLVEHGLAIIQP